MSFEESFDSVKSFIVNSSNVFFLGTGSGNGDAAVYYSLNLGRSWIKIQEFANYNSVESLLYFESSGERSYALSLAVCWIHDDLPK